MSNRNQKYGSAFDQLRSGFQSRDSYQNQNHTENVSNKGAYESFQNCKQQSSSSPYSHPLRSPSNDEALRIEQRHEELKRQIALKEKQLAHMTGERETVNVLRSKLGLKDLGPSESNMSFSHSRRNIPNEEQFKRGANPLASSISPDHSLPNMIGLKSTTYGRGQSFERGNGRNRMINHEDSQRDPIAQKYQSQQLHFHPTRMPANVTRANPKSSLSQSPLRQKSSNHDRDSEKNYQNEPVLNAYGDRPRDSSYSNYNRRSQGSNSPLRHQTYTHQTSAIIEEPIESSDNYQGDSSADRFQVQPVQANQNYQSGRPIMTSIPMNAREKLYRERIEAMSLDNQSLQRRLNQVTSELDRIQRENEAIMRQMEMAVGDVNRTNELINNKDDVDGQNNVFQQDLERMKNTNLDLNHHLKDEELKTSDATNKLGLASANLKSQEIDYDSLNHNLRQKIQRFDTISREKAIAITDLNTVNIELERLNRDELQFNHENIDFEANVARLQQERRELLGKIERITKQYDGTVKDLSYGKRNIDRDNQWHTKLIVTKNMHTTLDFMVKRRRQVIFNEMVQYSVFDGNCHQKLSNLANTLEKIGRYKQSVGLNQWYDRALKPYGTRLQNDDLACVQSCQNLTDRVFFAWKQYVFQKQEVYNFKQKAIQKIWSRLVSDSEKELKRAFEIWKQKKRYEQTTLVVLRRVAKKYSYRRTEQAINSWKRYSQELEYHCRIRLLHKEFTRKTYLSHVFTELKVCVRIQKQDRQRTLNAFFKAWNDYLMYNRHLMQSNMAAIALRNKNTEFTARACFQALKNATEINKFKLLKLAVQEDMDVVINETSAYNTEKQLRVHTQNQRRAGNITRDALGKRLFSYFHKWKQDTDDYRNTMNENVKNKILKVYNTKMNSFFTHWKKNIFDNHRIKKMKMVQELTMQQEAMTNEALSEEKKLRQQNEGDKSFQRRVTEKTFKKLFYRKLRFAIDRWRDICIDKGNKELRAEFVFKRMRKRLLQQAFDKYVFFLKKSLQHSKNELRADHIKDTLRLRELRKMYNALCYYTKWRRRVKQIWHKIFSKFDHFQKQRTLKTWSQNGHHTLEYNLKNKQHGLTNSIMDRNDELQQFHLDNHGQENFIGNQEASLRRKGYRQIGNMFLRLYTDQTQAKFNFWKQKVQLQRQKDRIMKRSIQHYERRCKQNIQMVFVNFMCEDKRREKLEKIKETEHEINDINHIIKQRRENQSKLQGTQGIQKMETTCASEETERKVLHTMECMSKRNLNWVYRSRKRMIFEMWRTVVKEEIGFAHAVKNVIMKSLLQEGFTRIKYQSRDIDFTQKVHRVLIRYSLKGNHIKTGDCFTKWKKFSFSKVDNKAIELQESLTQKVDDFESFRNAAQDTNLARVCKFFMEKNQQNIFKGLRNVTRHLKLVKQKTIEFHTRQDKLQRIWALKKWNMRVQKTVESRHTTNIVIEQYRQLYLRSCFRGWKRQYNTTRSLAASLSHLEYALRTKMQGEAFRNIVTFYKSKQYAIKNNNNLGAKKSTNILETWYLKKMNHMFQKFKDKCHLGQEGQSTFKSVFGKVGNKRLRHVFEHWRKKHSLCDLAQDQQETGPVRAQHWLAEKEIENMQQFMRDQHYTELEINKFYNDCCDHTERIMKKHIIRMKYKLDPNKKLFYQVMDRWKGFVQIRKTIKHQFNFIANFQEVQKGEMQMAFNKWKKGSDKLEEELWRLDYKTLEQIGLRTTKSLTECGDQISENQSINNHLVLQRDEFLNYYIKGQLLAMALVRDRTNFAKMQGISRWIILQRKHWVKTTKQNIRDDEYLLANLEEREEYLDVHNDDMVEENAEMEQFKADGDIIRSNKHRLSDDVEQLHDQMGNMDEEMRRLQEQKFELMALIQTEDEKIKENAERGIIPTFTKEHAKAKLKKQNNANQDVMKQEDETPAEKAMRLKMQELANLSKAGPALR